MYFFFKSLPIDHRTFAFAHPMITITITISPLAIHIDSAQQQHETAQLQHQQTTQQHATPLTTQNHNQYQNQHLSKAMTFWHQASTTPRSSYRSFFNSLADQIYSKRSTPSQLNINNGFNLTPTHRSSPVSSCCGSSSQGRSSPDTDPAEPPEFPLSPG